MAVHLFVGCCFQGLFKTAPIVLVLSLSIFSFRHFIKLGQPYSCTDTVRAWKNPIFISSEVSDIYMVANRSLVLFVFPMSILTSLSVEILQLGYMNKSYFRSLQFNASSVGCGWRIHKSYLCRRKRLLPTSILDITQINIYIYVCVCVLCS